MTTSEENIEDSNLKAPLKWAGGKRWLVPELKKIFLNYKNHRLVEPFVGGLSVYLGLLPKSALLNDINPHLINFYNQIKLGLVNNLEMQNDRNLFGRMRDQFNQLIFDESFNNKEAALLFYYLNRTGFNGLCRFNNKGKFNVPFGSYKKINYLKDFSNYKKLFENCTFSLGDFEALNIHKNDFLYVDPPYDVEFTKYSKVDFKWEDQERLVKWLLKQECPIVCSNQATPRIINLYKDAGFEVKILKAPRKISCNGNREAVEEILALRNFSKTNSI